MRSNRRAFFSSIAFLVSLCACATTSPPPAGPASELTVPPLSEKNGSVAIASDAKHECTMNLFAGRIRKSVSTCYIDEKISKEVGRLVVPCSGDGPAIVTFGAHRYNGLIHEGSVTFEIETELDWEDGCRWGTHAVLRGVVVQSGAPMHQPIAWEYVERVLSGSNCVTPCRAWAKIQSMPPNTTPKPRDNDDDRD